MFGTIQIDNLSNAGTSPQKSRKTAHGNKQARAAPVLACTACRRRKTRCDGAQPCQRCKDVGSDAPCIYVSSKPRTIVSQKTVEQLSTSLQQCQSVLKVLLPASDPSTLQDLSRKELIDRILFLSSSAAEDQLALAPPIRTDGSLALEQLQDTPSEFDEDSPDFIADDVNALDLSALRHSSYVGSSSISAALKVMSSLCPAMKKHSNLSQHDSPYPRSDRGSRKAPLISREEEALFVEAYFAHVHVLVPMIDEPQFRTNFIAGTREDAPWLGLLNMVLALGSIAALTCVETIHTVFYENAKKYLGLEAFGSGRLETIQAFALMGGFYLHYCNRPNMAVAVTAAAIRMACALGLHRESPFFPNLDHLEKADLQKDREIKRRSWWSLVCLDLWGSSTLGRPADCDHFGSSITVRPPTFDDPRNSDLADQAYYLIASVQYCRITAQVQERLSISSYLTPNDISHYNMKLTTWFESLPPPLRSPHRCSKVLLVPRAILRWRYQNVRLLLYRPALLHAALSHVPFTQLPQNEQDSIRLCQSIAGDTIIDIASDWQPDHICGWNAVWFLFQASMVPLLSMFYENDNVSERGKWRGQVDMVLRILQSMELWSAVAHRSREVIAEVYQASIEMSSNIRDGAAQPWDQQSSLAAQELWNTAMWDQVSQFPEFPFGPTDFGDYPHGR